MSSEDLKRQAAAVALENLAIIEERGLVLSFHSGFNWGGYYTPRAEALAKAAKQEFDPEAQNALLGKLHEVVVEDAMWIFVVHDLNPRALAPNVTGFVQAQSWLQDLTPVVVA